MPATTPFIRKLAANDRPTRDAAVQSLTTYLSSSSSSSSAARQFTQLDFLKLWKGLYYCYWHADRVSVQQSLALQLASLTHCFSSSQDWLRWMGAFYTTICGHWSSIDQWRLDKFYTLLRRFVAAGFERLRRGGWETLECEGYVEVLESGPLDGKDVKLPVGVQLHLADVYVTELVGVLRKERDGRTPRPAGGKSRNAIEERGKEEKEEDLALLAKDVPVALLLRPFERLARDTKSKPVKTRCLQEVLQSREALQMLGRSSATVADGTANTNGVRGTVTARDGDDEVDEDESEASFAGFD